MAEPKRLLILGGTGEAVALAARAAEVRGLEVITSLAGRTGRPKIPKGALRIGGFGGPSGLAAYLMDGRIDMVVDATHPFAACISRHAAEAALSAKLPFLMLVRPPWTKQAGDRWIEVDDVADAALALGDFGRRVFLTVGRQELDCFAGLKDTWFLVRLVERPVAAIPLPHGEIVTGRGPFTVEAEQSLITHHRIETLVSKNSGGNSTYAKIAAARALSLPVVMVRRPELPDAARVTDVNAAIDWVMRQLF